eukprot:scaffold7063_cov351-Pinguiococcus_pyrenoidosus.AAC.6
MSSSPVSPVRALDLIATPKSASFTSPCLLVLEPTQHLLYPMRNERLLELELLPHGADGATLHELQDDIQIRPLGDGVDVLHDVRMIQGAQQIDLRLNGDASLVREVLGQHALHRDALSCHSSLRGSIGYLRRGTPIRLQHQSPFRTRPWQSHVLLSFVSRLPLSTPCSHQTLRCAVACTIESTPAIQHCASKESLTCERVQRHVDHSKAALPQLVAKLVGAVLIVDHPRSGLLREALCCHLGLLSQQLAASRPSERLRIASSALFPSVQSVGRFRIPRDESRSFTLALFRRYPSPLSSVGARVLESNFPPERADTTTRARSLAQWPKMRRRPPPAAASCMDAVGCGARESLSLPVRR